MCGHESPIMMLIVVVLEKLIFGGDDTFLRSEALGGYLSMEKRCYFY